MRTTLFLLLFASPVVAQDASPYVPLSHWAMPYVEHLIARGRLTDPTPLTRPFRAADLLRALEAADSAGAGGGGLTPPEWRVVRRLRAELARPGGERGPAARVDVHAGIAASSHARRDPLREAGVGHGTASGGVALALFLGPVAVVTHPYFDTRLKWDPDWFGKKDRVIAGRNAEAYVSAQWRFGEVFFGSLDRNWGASGIQGVLLSDNPYGFDHLGIALGTPGIQLQAVATQLDDRVASTGTTVHRYMAQHRLWVRPRGERGRWTFALWEGSVLSGPGRQFEPWYLNIADLGVLQQLNTGTNVNSFVGVDFERRAATTVFGQFMLDDIQVDRKTVADQKPTSYALTLGAKGRLRDASAGWTVFYTQVSSLAYRNEDDLQVPLYHFLGTGRNFSDYDQTTVKLSLLPRDGLLLEPELTLLRQGEGDPRLPHPLVPDYPTTATIFAGVVERTLRLAVAARWDRGAWSVAGNGGVHFVHNAGHVNGARETRWVGRLELEWRYRKERLIP